MVVLEDGAIIVEKGRVRTRHDVETISRSSVLEIVNNGRQYGCEYLQIGQPILFKNVVDVTIPLSLNNCFNPV